MTDATPLASEQITQEDREAAWKYRPACYWLGDDTMEKWMAGAYDTAAPVIADFAGHRIAAISATPAPSDQDASQAQGEVQKAWATVKHELALVLRDGRGAVYPEVRDLDKAIAALSPAPGATAQDGVWQVDCERCAGNGEIVTDWDTYMHPPEGAAPEAGTADCPDCDGTGKVTPTPTIPAGMVARVTEAWSAVLREYGHAFGDLDSGYTREVQDMRDAVKALAAAPKQAEQQGVEVDAWQTFTLEWIGAPRPPVHPKPMKGKQTFDNFERAARFMLDQPADATFVSLHANLTRRYDRSHDMSAAIAAEARMDAALNAPTGAVEKGEGM